MEKKEEEKKKYETNVKHELHEGIRTQSVDIWDAPAAVHVNSSEREDVVVVGGERERACGGESLYNLS